MAHVEMLAWLDVNRSLATQKRLSAIGPTLNVFSDLNAFIDYITINATKSNSVVLITSGSFGQEVMFIVDAFPQLHAVYIYCTDVNKHIHWAKQCNKIGADRVFNQENDLIARLTADLNEATPNVCNLLFECSL
jgi:NADPH-dependent curcumin reductase CurA